MKSPVELEHDDIRYRPKASEVNRLWCDNRKINELTGFKPRYSLKQGLEETITWFKEPKNLIRYKSSLYNV